MLDLYLMHFLTVFCLNMMFAICAMFDAPFFSFTALLRMMVLNHQDLFKSLYESFGILETPGWEKEMLPSHVGKLDFRHVFCIIAVQIKNISNHHPNVSVDVFCK